MKNLVSSNKVSFERFKTEFETIIYAKLVKFEEKNRKIKSFWGKMNEEVRDQLC